MQSDSNYVATEVQSRIEIAFPPERTRQETAWALMKTRDKAAEIIGRLQGGEQIDRSDIDWPPMPG